MGGFLFLSCFLCSELWDGGGGAWLMIEFLWSELWVVKVLDYLTVLKNLVSSKTPTPLLELFLVFLPIHQHLSFPEQSLNTVGAADRAKSIFRAVVCIFKSCSRRDNVTHPAFL